MGPKGDTGDYSLGIHAISVLEIKAHTDVWPPKSTLSPDYSQLYEYLITVPQLQAKITENRAISRNFSCCVGPEFFLSKCPR